VCVCGVAFVVGVVFGWCGLVGCGGVGGGAEANNAVINPIILTVFANW